jgi:hypothetical protein
MLYRLSRRKIENLRRKCPPLIFAGIFSSTDDDQKLNEDPIVVSSHWKKYKHNFALTMVENQAFISTSGVAELTQLNFINFLRYLKNQILCLVHYSKFSKNLKIIIKIIYISIKTRRLLCFDMTKHGILIDKLSRSKNVITDSSKVTIIGDGFGFAGTLIKIMYPKTKIHFHNLSFNGRLDMLFSSLVFNKEQLRDITFTYAENSELEKADVYLNVASFGEMTKTQIKIYFDIIRAGKGTLICLNREKKVLPSGEVTLFNDYGWKKEDKIFTDEVADFYTENPADRQKFDGIFLLRIAKLN